MAAQAAVNEEETPVASASTAASREARRASRNEAQDGDAASESTTSKASATKKRQPKRKSKNKFAATVAESGIETEEPEQNESAPRERQKKPRKKKRRRTSESDREEEVQEVGAETQVGDDAAQNGQQEDEESSSDESSESEPEQHEIDPNTKTMSDLYYGRDKRYGKTSNREKQMSEIDWDEVARKRQEALEQAQNKIQPPATAPDVVETTEGPSGTAEPPQEEARTAAAAASEGTTTTIGGVRFRLFGDQIVEDENSLTVDRHAQAEAEARTGAPVEEESDLTRRLNRLTYINDRRRDAAERVGPIRRGYGDAWNEQMTDRFYEALKMFGTDFYIISKMFPPKTRKQIKTKFVREERLDSGRINSALLGKETKPMDLEHYADQVGRPKEDFLKYRSIEHAESMIDASLGDKREAMLAAVAEQEEDERQREVHAQMKGGGGKKGKGVRRKKGEEGTTAPKRRRGKKAAAAAAAGTWGGGAPDEMAAGGEG